MNAERLKKLLEMGHRVELTSVDGVTEIFTEFIDVTYEYPHEQFVSRNVFWAKKGIEDQFKSGYKIVTKPPLMLEVGDRCAYKDSERFFVEKVNIGGYTICRVLNDIKNDSYDVPHWAVAPVLEEEKKDEPERIKMIEEINECFDEMIEILKSRKK